MPCLPRGDCIAHRMHASEQALLAQVLGCVDERGDSGALQCPMELKHCPACGCVPALSKAQSTCMQRGWVLSRDHRKLGQQLSLFSISETAGPGLVFWHPKGAMVSP